MILLLASMLFITACQVPVGGDIQKGQYSSTERPIPVDKNLDSCGRYNKLGAQAEYACVQDRNCVWKNGTCLTKIQSSLCDDGTKTGECSVSVDYGEPYFCDDQLLLTANCFDCGCPENSRCTASGYCEFKQEGVKISVSTEKNTYYTGENIKLSSQSREILPENSVDVVNSIPVFYKKYQSNIVQNVGGLYVSRPITRTDFDGYIVVLKDSSALEEWKRLSTAAGKRVAGEDLSKQITSYAENIKEIQDSLLGITENQNSVTGNQVRSSSLVLKSRYTSILNGLWIDGSQEEIDRIRRDPRVKSVTPSYFLYPTLYRSVSNINAKNAAYSGTTLTGKGVKVAILDTGIDYTHNDFGKCSKAQIESNRCPKIVESYNTIGNDKDVFDTIGHGTHVASIIASNGVIKGVAPNASLMIYKVCEEDGCPNGAIFDGLERAIDPNKDYQYNDRADVISLSIGGPASDSPELDPFTPAINNAVNAGSTVVIAAGNSGPDKGSVESPGLILKAITVGASCLPSQVWKQDYCKTEYPFIAIFSSRGPSFFSDKPDIVAPGVDICAAKSTTTLDYFGEGCYDSEHISLSGTSMATPHVSGAIALIKQAHPDWDYVTIKNALKSTATDLGYPRYIQGSGLINVKEAVNFDKSINLEITGISGGYYTEVGE